MRIATLAGARKTHSRSLVYPATAIVCWKLLPLMGFLVGTPVVSGQVDLQCPSKKRNATELKEEYVVGVLAIRGKDAAYDEFNSTFSDYLTLTAGARFDRSLTFKMKPLNFVQVFEDVERGSVDFIYVNPSAFSCIESEYGANTLVSQISRRTVAGQTYDLTKFGGVIFARSDNDKVNSIRDIRDQRVACASISGLGSGQMQFRLLQQKGLSYINDPKQMVFTSNQRLVVNGVLNGDFDVGYVRTDQIERTPNVSTSDFKIIEPRSGLTVDGKAFPFNSSTPLYPEWNVASLTHVSNEVAVEVQKALLDLSDHARVGSAISECYAEKNCDNADDPKACRKECETTCDETTTPEVALTAFDAKSSGKYTGFRSTLSYMELRNMQEETSFIVKDPSDGKMRCVRIAKLYDAIVCPPGYFKRSEREVESGCKDAGLSCENYTCVCSPCVKGFDVDVFPAGVVRSDEKEQKGCGKMDVCGNVQQREEIMFQIVDNKKRHEPNVTVVFREGANTVECAAKPSSAGDLKENLNEYSFNFSSPKVGYVLVEVYVNEEQIPESPLQLQVLPRLCGESRHEPDSNGNCVCKANSVEILSSCVPYKILFPSLFIPLVIIAAALVFYYVEHKRKQADSVWEVKPGELHFDDPPIVLGRGTFGHVVLAEYRGTLVAVKRVIPPKDSRKKPNVNGSRRKGSDASTTEATRPPFGVTFDEPPMQCPADLADRLEASMLDDSLGRIETFRPGDKVPAKRPLGVLSERGSTVDQREFPPFECSPGNEEGAPARLSKSAIEQRRTHDALPEAALEEGLSETDFVRASSGGSAPTEKTADLGAHRRNSSTGSLNLLEEKYQRRNSGSGFSEQRRLSGGGGFDPNRQRRRISFPGTAVSTNVVFDFDNDESNSQELDNTVMNGLKSGTLINFNRGLQSSNSNGTTSGSFGIFGGFFRTKDDRAKLKADFITEMRHLSKLRHPCVTTVMGAVISKWEEPTLVMEYMEFGSLYDILHNETMVVEGELVLPILRDIAQGMRFLHAATPRVIHGDLKAQNVLVDTKFRAKVADFGLSQKKHVGATGTPLWMAPELLRGESDNTASSDVYSFGIILYEVYSRKVPYDGENHEVVLRLIQDPTVNKRPPVPQSCPPAVASIMRDCLVSDPLSRPSFEEMDLRLKRLDVENVEPGQMRFSRQLRKTEAASKNEELLFEVFPKHVAEALRDGRKVEPESRECVTIFFSDIVGFTKISSSLPPMKVSDMLDRLYLRFDELSRKHDVFKVETIGDAYMAVTNLVKDQEDHAKRIAEFAIDAVEAAQETMIDLEDPRLGNVHIRVGFHSGPVVANVVGSRNPHYGLFGDTVNTASRMESNSQSNRIHCSQRSAEVLRIQDPTLPLLSRGSIQVKGKDEMHTYWVNEGKASEPLEHLQEAM